MSLSTQITDCLATIGNWTADDNLRLQGVFFGENTKAQFDTIIDAYVGASNWISTVAYARRAEQWNYWTSNIETRLKSALTGLVAFGTYALPKNYQDVNWYYRLAGMQQTANVYRFSQLLQHTESKWDAETALEGLKRIWALATKLWDHGEPNTPAYVTQFNGRWYEAGWQMDAFQLFGKLGYSDAWDLVERSWQYLNDIHWSTDHFNYARGMADWEKTSLPVYMLAALWYVYQGRTLSNWNRLLIDMQGRYLTDRWQSQQWYYVPGGPFYRYSAIHHTANGQRLLADTTQAWYFLHMFYGHFTSENQQKMRDILEGYTAKPNQGWTYFTSADSGLFDGGTDEFKWKSDDGATADDATAHGCLTLILMGISPQSGRGLALPLFDSVPWNLKNHWPWSQDLFSWDNATRTLRIPVWKNTTLKFLFGTTPFTESFDKTGVWECRFSTDFDSMLSKGLVSPLITGTNRFEYLYHPEDVHGNWKRLVEVFERHNINFDATKCELMLGIKDTTTGWFTKTFVETPAKIYVVPKSARTLQMLVGYYVTLDASGFTTNRMRKDDRIKVANQYYEVVAVHDFNMGNVLSHRVCDLKKIPLYEGA